MPPPSRRKTASAARSPDSHAPPTVPHKVSCAASPANHTVFCSGSIRMRRAPWPPGAAAEKAPSVRGSWIPARSLGALDRLFHIVAVELGQPIRREIDHGSLAIGGELAAETAADFDQAKVRARNIGENGRCARTGRFLEHQFVSLEAEGIAGEFKRNVVVAAEREFAERVSLSLGKLGRELDGAGCKNVGRYRDDHGVCRDRAARRFDHYATPHIDCGCRRRQSDRNTLGQRSDQRAEPLPAK